MASKPTQRSLALLRSRGCAVGIVEKFNSFTKRRVDLFGFGDLVAVLPTGEPFIVQTTSGANQTARRDKIRLLASAHPALAAMVRTGRVVLHSWAKRGPRGGTKVWTANEEIVTFDP